MTRTEVVRFAIALLLIAAGLCMNGCNGDLSVLHTAKITKVVLTHPNGGMVVTSVQVISELIQSMKSAKRDNTLYDCQFTLRIDFHSNDTLAATIWASGSLFRFGKNQYYERSGKFQEIIHGLTEEDKAPSQSSAATPKPGAPQ